MLRITKKFLRENNFSCDGINFDEDEEEKFFRPRRDMYLPPSADEQMSILRIKFDKLMRAKKKSYAQLEVLCDINESTMRKYLNGQRSITRNAVAKFCVGLQLTIEQSEELFLLQGHCLDAKHNRFDALVVNALQDGDDIGIFFETCKEFNIEIFK